MSRFMVLSLSIFSLLALFGTGMAHADQKTIPGSMCERWTGGQKTLYFSGVANSHRTSTLKVDCPIIRDNKAPIDRVYIKAVDKSAQANIRCRTCKFHRDGSSWVGGCTGNVSTAGSGSTAKNLVIDSYPSQKNWPTTMWANAYVACEIPPRRSNSSTGAMSFVHAISYVEVD